MYDAIMAETVTIAGSGDDPIEGYFARPLGPGPYGAVVVIHHMPGYDSATKEMTRTFAANGYLALCPNLYAREAPGASPDDAAAAARAAGGVPDDRLLGDVAGAAAFLRSQSSANGKVGTIGHCSGGRQAFLTACELDIDATVDCYGAFVGGTPPQDFPIVVAPVLDRAHKIDCPVLGLFGEDDKFPAPAEVAEIDAELDRLGKHHEFHTYEGAGHSFFSVDRPSYRPVAAVDGWAKIFDFYHRFLEA
jgi:carboxymethylenebutenolidase